MAGLLFGVEFLLVAQGLVYSTASHISVFSTPRRCSPRWACTGCCRKSG